jgi:hypothetical protein
MARKPCHALLIGIASYRQIAALPPSVIHDVEAIYAALVDPACGGYDPANVVALLDGAATRDSIAGELAGLAARCGDDATVMIYISAHGGRIVAGQHAGEYLLPSDADPSTPEAIARTAIGAGALSAALRAIPARRLVAIFDCCHAAGLAAAKAGAGPALKAGLSEQLYTTLAAGRGRVIMASSRADELSWIMPGAPNSLFTQLLLAGLRGEAPGPGGVIRVLDLFSYVAPLVTGAQPRQHPVLKAEIEENFALARHPGGAAEPAPPRPPADRYAYDVFLSYRAQEPDRSWVRKTLRPTLEAGGLRVCIDHRDFRMGEPLLLELERAVEQSRYTLAVLTPGYLESGFAELESVLAQHLGLEAGQRRLLTVIRASCRPRLGMRAQLALDMTDDDEFAENLARLSYELRRSPGREGHSAGGQR